MDSGNALATAALETLPITVAVIDADGKIVLTNRSWSEFGPAESTDHVGDDYVETARIDDEHARRAVDGLESLLDGERAEFTMEYPCHSPEQKQWFLMWANRFTVDGETRVSVVHLEITERKLAEIAAEETAAELREEHEALEHVLARVDGLLRDVTGAVVDASTREEIERRVSTRLAETDPYVLAWVGRADVTNQRLAPREWASADGTDIPLEDDELVLSSDESHPGVRALVDGETVVIQDLESFADAERWWPTGAGDRFRSVAALPLSYGDVSYGVLVVFAAEANVFTGRERLVLESLSETIATAMNAIEARRMLTTDSVVEFEVAIDDPELFLAALTDALGAELAYRGQTYDETGAPVVFLNADRSIDTVPPASDIDGIADLTVLSAYDGGCLLEVVVDDGLVATLSEHGATVRRFDLESAPAADGSRPGRTVDLSITVPNGQSARSIYDSLERRYDVVELISYHETDRPTQTPTDVMGRLESSLTGRQFTALQKAYYADYFEWPRNVSGEELAESMDISRSTFHQHLRAAQRKLLDELFAKTPTSEG